jgi:hypothetical protein
MYGKKKRTKARAQNTISVYEKEVLELDLKRSIYISQIESQIHENFINNGGCDTCHGRGWIIDVGKEKEDNYHFAACPNDDCTHETRARSGLDVGYSMHDRKAGLRNPYVASPLYKIMIEPLDLMICELMAKIIEERKSLNKKTIVVPKTTKKTSSP